LGQGASQEAIDAQLKEVERIVGSATGLDAKRGDRISVAAVEFLPNDRQLEPVPSIGFLDHLMIQSGTIVKALAFLAATFALIWFGLRPITRMLLTPAGAATSGLPSLEGPGGAGSLPMASALGGEMDFSAGGFAGTGGYSGISGNHGTGEPPPNLLGDIASQIERTPQKRLEQLIDFDDEKAAAVMKQWMREAMPA